MGRNDGLSCLRKRDVLNQSSASAEMLQRWAAYYEENGLIYDALDFHAKLGDRESLLRLMKRVQAEGDFFLFRRICSLVQYEPSHDEWLSLAQQAEREGKLLFAAEAYRMAGVGAAQEPTESSQETS